jgi:peptide deformylase
MVLEIVKYGHPALRQKGAKIDKVDDKLRQLAADMLETMVAANGVGLAAQQVGVPLQLTVIDVADVEDRPSTMSIDGKEVPLEEHMPLVLLNPVLELGPEKETGVEGCLSFPEMTADISRSMHVKARAKTLDGKTIEFESTGLLARALQHEIDHLHGVLFIDRMNAGNAHGPRRQTQTPPEGIQRTITPQARRRRRSSGVQRSSSLNTGRTAF